jgi:hypothetical protein
MNKPAFLFFVFIALTSLGIAQEKTSITPQMAQNLKAMNSIMLHFLVDENYQVIATNSQEIIQHANDIMGKSPTKEGQKVFESYALQLEANASILKVLAEKIQKGAGEKQIDTSTLKKTAALTYGQIVTSCVSCHQQFRIR